jgi:hypothetical protein
VLVLRVSERHLAPHSKVHCIAARLDFEIKFVPCTHDSLFPLRDEIQSLEETKVF